MKHKWTGAWALQIVEMLAAGLLAALAQGWGALAGGILLWGLAPLAGMASSLQATRRGLNNYLAWLAPAPCLYAAFMLLWGFAPPAGPALLTAFTSLVGAAAGEVLKSGKGPGRRRPK